MYIESVPNRNSPPAVLLRESFREDGKVRKRTLANLSCLNAEVIEGLKVLLAGGAAVANPCEMFTVGRSLPHGHVAAVLGGARGCGAAVWFAAAPKPLGTLLQAMLVARITDSSLSYQRKSEHIATEAAMDGLYVIRTSLGVDALDANAAVAAYKSLAHVEHAFRSIKTVELNVRPVFHYNEQRVCAHVFQCMLAYYVEWHMRARPMPMLFEDEEIEAANATRASAVAKAVRSEYAKAKDASKIADGNLPLHSFRTLLKDLGTLAYNITHTSVNPQAKIILTTQPTPVQVKAFKLLALNPACTQ